MVSPVAQIESLYKRLEKARELIRDGRVHPVAGLEDHFTVESARLDAGVFLVNSHCTCRDAKERTEDHRGWCKHMLAVEIYKAHRREEDGRYFQTPPDYANPSSHTLDREGMQEWLRQVDSELFGK